LATSTGGLAWVVRGHGGENFIRAESSIETAWRAAVDPARSLGRLGSWAFSSQKPQRHSPPVIVPNARAARQPA
jgi:hypothetical protein